MITIEIYQRIIELQRIENVIEQKEEIYKLLTGKDPESMTLEKFLKEYRKEIAKLEIPLEPIPLMPFKVGVRTFTPLMEYAKWQTWRFISYWEVCKKEPENIALQMAIMTEEKKGEKLDQSEILARADLFYKEVDYKVAHSFSVFFWKLSKPLQPLIVAYLAETEKQTPFQSNGVGM
jgi:hypothetical protein